MEDFKKMEEVIKSLFPMVCILSAVILAFCRPDAEKVELALLTIGGTAYQVGNKIPMMSIEEEMQEEQPKVHPIGFKE